MQVVVLGAGAIGCLYASRLQAAGAEITLVSREYARRGPLVEIPVDSCHWESRILRARAIAPGEPSPVSPDLVVLSLKVLPEVDRVALLRPLIGDRPVPVVLIQNGVGIESALAESFGAAEIISTLAFVCVSREADGRINHQDYGHLAFGTWPEGFGPGAELAADWLERGGVRVDRTANVRLARWKKLAWNAAFNPVSVLAGGLDTAQMLANAACRTLICRVIGEVRSIAAADGCLLPETLVEDQIAHTRSMVPYRTSMLLDADQGRPMEVEAILGNPLRIARQHGLDVPALESLYGLLQPLDEQRNQRSG